MADKPKDEKEMKRRKQLKKMTKILSKAWELPDGEPFQECSKKSSPENAFDLGAVGDNLDKAVYKLGRSGWVQFARDMGGVYNRHIQRKTKFSITAKNHRNEITQMLGKIDESLAVEANQHCPRGSEQKGNSKRKADGDTNRRPSKKASADKKSIGEMTIVEREAKAIDDLYNYIEEVGGDRQQVSSFTSRATKKNDGRYDVNFFSQNRRFRSMVEVARFLHLVKDKEVSIKKIVNRKQRPSSSRDAETEKRKIRKELEKMMKAHQKATKSLDDFRSDQADKQYPVNDDVLIEELADLDSTGTAVTAICCPAARVPDLDGFPGVPDHCIPDLLMVWDFLCTFGRALSLNPIQLDDFVAALTFQPPGLEDGINPTTHHPPVYLAEAHLGLLKLLLQDPSSDEWWWSILDTDEKSGAEEGDVVSAAIDPRIPVIKIDFAAVLAYQEDPLITASWLQALDEIRSLKTTEGRQIKQVVKTASAIAANRWVKAYMKKSLTDWKPDFAMFTKRAIVWLIDRVREAKPELYGRSITTKSALKQRAELVEQIALQMEKMDDSGDIVAVDDDLDSDDEDLDSEDDSDDENEKQDSINRLANGSEERQVDENEEPVKSAIPEKPPPTLVDLLLPPSKPLPASDVVSSFTWPHLAGASACRILHSYKRMRNEVDDKLRDTKGLPPISMGERKQREAESASRILSESATQIGAVFPTDMAAQRLSKGGNYLELSIVERLCLLKTLVDAAYDSLKVHEVVDSNYKQRFSAVKALDAEERRAKREAREEAAADDQAAREALAAEARNKFLEDKRNELRKLNQRTNDYSDDVINDLTDEDIVDFDEDSKAEYLQLPTPQSYNKAEVKMMVKKMQEQAAFDTHSVAVITLDRIGAQDEEELRCKESEASAYDNVDIYELGREASRKLDRLRRDIDYIKESVETLPEVRESAMDMLREAIEDGTVKSLKAAIRVAKQAKLSGHDESTGGVWAVDLLRDAALELKSAERRKRVIEAKKDLVAKMNKCFIRLEPLGRDRFRNRFWHFENDESARVYVEAQYILENEVDPSTQSQNHVNLVRPLSAIVCGAAEKECDLIEAETDGEARQKFLRFSRKEFHRSGESFCLTKRYWGGHATEKALKGLAKNLDDRGTKENELKSNLKEALERSGLAPTVPDENMDEGEAVETLATHEETLPKANDEEIEDDGKEEKLMTNGDADFVNAAIRTSESSVAPNFSSQLVNGLLTGIGARVRVRLVVDANKQPLVAHYHLGVVVGWKQEDEIVTEEGNDLEIHTTTTTYPLWKATLDRGGGEIFLTGSELIESICRYKKWKRHDKGYSEYDAAFLSYRNSLGRHCGKAAEAGLSATPMFFARLTVKREQELYTPIKSFSFDNNWGGKSGARNAWILSMKEDCFDFDTAKKGLLNFENAYFELTGGFPDSMPLPPRDAKSLLDDLNARFDVELESIEKEMKTLWNSRQSREIFHEVVNMCSTTGILVLALDLLCRNGWTYVESNQPKGRRAASSVDALPAPGMRTTRRMNAWQQANQNQDWF